MITLWDDPPKQTFIEYCVGRSLPYLPAEEANAEVVRLTVEILRLQAQLDAKEMKDA